MNSPLPCPICGAEPRQVHQEHSYIYTVLCDKDHSEFGVFSVRDMESAIKFWNIDVEIKNGERKLL